jgi:hypothetical protein
MGGTVVHEYLPLLSAAAVTGVACVLIVNTAADVFALEPTGRLEPGEGPPVMTVKYRGLMARVCRWMIVLSGAFLATCYTTLLFAVMLGSTLLPGWFSFDTLNLFFVLVISATIVVVCWIAFLATLLRWKHMRHAGRV